MTRTWLPSIASAVALVMVPGLAFASEGEDVPAPHPPSAQSHVRRELAVSVGHGIFGDGQGIGVVLGGEALHRRGPFAVGVVGDYARSGFSNYSYWGGGFALGVSTLSPRWFRLDLLGVLGAHSYAHVGSPSYGLFYQDVGAGSQAVLPFVGARLRASFEFGASSRFALGIEAIGEADTTHVQRRYESAWLEPSPYGVGMARESRTRTVGTERLSGALTLGGTFDL